MPREIGSREKDLRRMREENFKRGQDEAADRRKAARAAHVAAQQVPVLKKPKPGAKKKRRGPSAPPLAE